MIIPDINKRKLHRERKTRCRRVKRRRIKLIILGEKRDVLHIVSDTIGVVPTRITLHVGMANFWPEDVQNPTLTVFKMVGH